MNDIELAAINKRIVSTAQIYVETPRKSGNASNQTWKGFVGSRDDLFKQTWREKSSKLEQVKQDGCFEYASIPSAGANNESYDRA